MLTQQTELMPFSYSLHTTKFFAHQLHYIYERPHMIPHRVCLQQQQQKKKKKQTEITIPGDPKTERITMSVSSEQEE